MMQSHIACSQEQRLAHLEAALSGIQNVLTDMKDLLIASIKSEERITALQQDRLDQEKRIRKLEHVQAAGRWVERAVWLIVAGAVSMWVKFGGKQ